MIDEFFLKSAINIRREYLKISNNMDLYQKRAKEVVNILEETISKIENIQKENKKNPNISTEKNMNDLLEILKNVEEEGKRLESLVEPINKSIEKLSKEEVILYEKIKEKYKNLTDEAIVKEISDRLEKEGLL